MKKNTVNAGKLGLAIKRLSNLLERHFYRVAIQLDELHDVTEMQGWVIAFIAENPDKDIFQRDIEAELNIRSSSATTLLQRMEKKGLIVRNPIPGNTRWKKIVLTQKTLDLKKKVFSQLKSIENRALKGFGQSEKVIFLLAIEKICRNLDETS